MVHPRIHQHRIGLRITPATTGMREPILHGDIVYPLPVKTMRGRPYRRARGKFKSWRDTMADRPRTADYAWTVLARVLSVAKDRGLIAVNVCERGGRLYETNRTEIVWTAEHISKFCAVASEPLQFALLLALWTGQRQGDLVRLMDAVRRRQNPPAPRKEQGEETCCRGTAAGWPAPGEGGRRDPAQYFRRAVDNGRLQDIMGEGVRSGPGWATKTCIFTTCAAPPSPAWHSQAAPSRKLRPLPDTARATWRRSLRRIILAAGWS
jgi:hypothetical protein